MRPLFLFLFLILFESVSSSFFNMFAASSTASPQYRAYGGGCTSSGCVPPTIVPMTSGFWPSADYLVGLQTQEQMSQNQNQQGGVQRDDTGFSGSLGSGSGFQGSNNQNQLTTSTPTPVIYIARAGSDQYKYSVSSTTPAPVGSSVGWNTGVQSQFGNAGLQTQNQNQGSSQFGSNFGQNQNQNQGGQSVQSPFQQNQNQGSSGFQNNGQNQQNPYNQGSTSGQFGFGSSNTNFGSGSSTGNVETQNNNQNQGSGSANTNIGSGSSSGSQSNLPFGPNLLPQSSNPFGPQPQPRPLRPPPQPFSENDWNFHPGSQGVHFVGNNNGNSNLGQGSTGMTGMTDEAQQIAVQIQAIRDNLSITRDESNYLINQLKASLPPELQNQLSSI